MSKKTKILNRLKSKQVWFAFAALVIFLVKTFACIDISETVDGLLNVLLPFLISLGIVHNPDKEDNNNDTY